MSMQQETRPFIPESLPLRSLDWTSLIRSMGEANRALARYDGILQGIINPDVLLSPLVTQEAVLSSRIEGTQATLEEVLEFEATQDDESKKGDEDIREIINYRQAMQIAVKSLEKRPITLNLIREIHAVLLNSVRGQNMARGQFRRNQNWIGHAGSPIEKATFIPPDPMFLMEHLSNLEKYIHYDEEDRLVQLAIVHAQFEIIHPFMDGNGRVGRILIPLFLFEKALLSSPNFYISAYLESNRELYYAKLRAISEAGDWDGWIQFFLQAVSKQAKANSDKAIAVMDLYNQMKTEIADLTHSPYSIQALDTLFGRPIFNTTGFILRSAIPRRTALRILGKLQQENILAVLREGRGRRAALLAFPRLLAIAEN